ncbi:hypothetical protein PR048_011342 [Dryococelus australis]|uniref:Uncharacterized protein n=1 Tax=Dryococelus australis TaxID=614101 RepID=A0ABQ9HLC4_9NEOP|nr:hypothetical protein PR048_011342 [Dryococelus australis]
MNKVGNVILEYDLRGKRYKQKTESNNTLNRTRRLKVTAYVQLHKVISLKEANKSPTSIKAMWPAVKKRRFISPIILCFIWYLHRSSTFRSSFRKKDICEVSSTFDNAENNYKKRT